MAMAMKTVKAAMENMEYVRRLLGQKQPGFAASLELAASQLERKLREPVIAPQNRRHVCSPAVAALVADLEPGKKDDRRHLHHGPAGREASAGDYDALILPGGAVNPDNLRQHEAAVGFANRVSTPGAWFAQPMTAPVPHYGWP